MFRQIWAMELFKHACMVEGEDLMTLRLEEQGRDAKAGRGYVKKTERNTEKVL